jgi:hypothetical protein
MKNLHILPTEEESRLQVNKHKKMFLSQEPKAYLACINQNIYITNDEEIKEGDYYITPNNTILKALGPMLINVEDYKKIILTTDFRLAPDVQKIDDEFLEWFVKNPSCERVEVIHWEGYSDIGLLNYEIIIPKQEPDYTALLQPVGTIQETLEEAAERTYREYPTNPIDKTEWNYNKDINCFRKRKAFINGAKWQQERSYSEEEVLDLLYKLWEANPRNIKEWFEQFKNK